MSSCKLFEQFFHHFKKIKLPLANYFNILHIIVSYLFKQIKDSFLLTISIV